jgi:hypothetical protein
MHQQVEAINATKRPTSTTTHNKESQTMQVLLHSTMIFIVVSFFSFAIFDFAVNIIALWNSCKPQQIASQQMQAEPEAQPQIEPQPQIQPQPQQEILPDVWSESEASFVKRPMQPAALIFQLALPPAKQVIAPTPVKKAGRPKKSVATTLPTAEASLAATFCQPSQIAVAPKKRGRPKKSVA